MVRDGKGKVKGRKGRFLIFVKKSGDGRDGEGTGVGRSSNGNLGIL